jgi:hypothetical protein
LDIRRSSRTPPQPSAIQHSPNAPATSDSSARREANGITLPQQSWRQSPADPAARWTGAHGGQAFFAYSTNYLIDTDNAIIVDVEATTDPSG